MNAFDKYKQKNLNKKLLAAANQGLDTIQELLAKGADIHVRNAAGENLLDLIIEEKNITFFLEKGLTFSTQEYLDVALYYCIKNPETLSLLIDAGADVNSQDEEGDTPLHIALFEADIEAVRLLLKHKARLDIRNDGEETPVDLAHRGYTETGESFYQDVIKLFDAELTRFRTGSITHKSELSFIHEKPELNLRITEIFNFKSGIYREIIYCKDTNTQSNTVISFSAIEDTKHLADAEAEFIKQGGVPEYSMKKRLNKH
jgi:hypothetical protein